MYFNIIVQLFTTTGLNSRHSQSPEMDPLHYTAHLCYLPHDADCPEYSMMPDQQGLGNPAKEVAENEHIKAVPKTLKAHVRAVHSIFLVVEVHRGTRNSSKIL